MSTFTPKYPSVITNMPDADYRAIEAVSSTTLKTMWRSCPATAKAQMDGLLDDDDRQCLVEGIAAHVAALQPDRFEAEYAVGPVVDLRTKAGKAAWDAAISEHPGKTLLRAEAGELVTGIRKSVWGDKHASAILKHATDIELSVFWLDPETGLPCKARADIVCRGIAVLPDFKTCQSAKPEKFLHHAYDYAYHIQLSHYWAGMAANGISIEEACIIAAEKKAPYPVMVYAPTEEWLLAGERDRKAQLARFKVCQEANHWPSYSEGVTPLALPYKATKQDQNYYAEAV
jgi:hypothetical protein